MPVAFMTRSADRADSRRTSGNDADVAMFDVSEPLSESEVAAN
jgi:hypothetical protein